MRCDRVSHARVEMEFAIRKRLSGAYNERTEYFSWDGQSERETTVKSWNRVFQKLFSATEPPIVGGHAPRFRDTFAISLLLKGVDLANVSILLGHSSIKVTERHYSPWVKARQEQLEADVRRTWPQSNDSKDPPASKRRGYAETVVAFTNGARQQFNEQRAKIVFDQGE